MTDVEFTETMTVPYSKQAEEAVIGAVLINPDCFGALNLTGEDFYIHRNQWIWECFARIHASYAPIDYVTVAEELEKSGHLAEIGGPSRLVTLIQQVPTSLHAEAYAETVREKAKRRRVIAIANELAKAAYTSDDMDTAIGDAATQLVMNAAPSGGAVPFAQCLGRLYDDVSERTANPKDIYGIPTGLRDFDRITSGMQRGEEFILSGEPGLGKSILAFQMGIGMAASCPGAVYEMEMGDLQVARRAISAKSKVSAHKLKSGKDWSEVDWFNFTQAIQAFEKLPIYLSDSSHWTTTAMRADLARLKETAHIEWFIVDYLDLLSDRYSKDPHENSQFISRQVHNICKDLDLAGLVIQTMSKEGFRNPSKSGADLSGSAKLRYDADQIAFITKNKDNPNLITLTWDKMREGDVPERFLDLVQVPGFPMFADVSR